jgi:hypothetical protein
VDIWFKIDDVRNVVNSKFLLSTDKRFEAKVDRLHIKKEHEMFQNTKTP